MGKGPNNSPMEDGVKRMSGVLFGLLTVVVLVGCSSPHHRYDRMGGGKSDAYWQKGQQDMEGLINRTVKNPDKARQVNAIVGDIITELKAGREQERAYHRQLYTLNASYTATPDEFTKILDEATDKRMQSSAKVLNLRFKMKDLMTADEWKALSDRMISYSGRYQQGSEGAKTAY